MLNIQVDSKTLENDLVILHQFDHVKYSFLYIMYGY